MESVRPAGPGDLARSAELLAAAQREATGRRGGDLLTQLRESSGEGEGRGERTLERWISGDPTRVLLVGLIDDQVVGVGLARAPAGGTAGRIECCYVEPEARQVGVGGALVVGLLEWLTGRGCRDVDAAALPGDRSTKQLLEAAGFKARLLTLHRRLG